METEKDRPGGKKRKERQQISKESMRAVFLLALKESRKHLTLLFYTLTSPSIITLKVSEGVLRSLEDVLGKDLVFF